MSANIKKEKSFQSLDPYFNISYDFKGRFCSYWHQIREVFEIKPDTMLEVGVGSGFASRYLRQKRIKVITIDISCELQPDIVSSILATPFANSSFDVATCCEVLEHLPYENFTKALDELARVTRKFVLLSLPDATKVYRFNVELPRKMEIKKLIPSLFSRPTRHEFDGYHYWEIGKKGYPLNKIKLDIIHSGFNLIKTYRVFECHYHRFFLLEKV